MQFVSTGAAIQKGDRPANYYNQFRPDVAELVPSCCRRVLDVGCGEGNLGRALQELGHLVTGVELTESAAEMAARHLHHVETRDVERDGFPFAAKSFDAIIFADVLEHFVDPWRVLREATRLLADEGVVIASIPNVQNWAVLRRLFLGRWEYRERGIMDRGHLRFFTLRTIRELFEQAGLDIVDVKPKANWTWPRRLAKWVTAGWATRFIAREYLVVAKPVQNPLAG